MDPNKMIKAADLLKRWAHALYMAGIPAQLTLTREASVLVRTPNVRTARDTLGLRLPDDVQDGVRFCFIQERSL